MEWKLGDSFGISGSSDAPRKLCSARKRTMFYLCESEASAAKRPVGTEINHTLW
ncbi:hypothetical protein [Lysinibacillus sp. FJAT-14222]|uniref:hypothetical protein n=1 Tax=Lysinibacillus sp. FJAT-14222 TaxID=1932366 RepID=UPI001300DF71|nr:hypothetical protein [Lysinibacillus sp. FJAT-14222]